MKQKWSQRTLFYLTVIGSQCVLYAIVYAVYSKYLLYK
jgi:hypothetical protein